MDKSVAILFARKDSIYKTFEECDVYDEERNALTYVGDAPIIAHPPCRAWGKLKYFARPAPGEKEMALWSIDQIRLKGGVLEHPASSDLRFEKELPEIGKVDCYGGRLFFVSQHWFGHKADKKTLIYFVGLKYNELPNINLRIDEPQYVVTTSKRKYGKMKLEITKSEREHTPVDFAKWLIEIAKLSGDRVKNEKKTKAI